MKKIKAQRFALLNDRVGCTCRNPDRAMTPVTLSNVITSSVINLR